jgi:hypothetical protein
MPDGTSVGGTPSVLFQTMNAKFATATWELQIQKAAAVWEAVANINLAQVSDDGSPEACNGNQQDDPRFGDIRIGAIDLGTSVLGETFLPPPFNGGTDAGDIFLNSDPVATWNINSAFDLETVAIHELGHALGLGESQVSTACMYAYYNATKQSLTSDDIAGIQSVWGAPQYDQFNTNGLSNGTYRQATNLNSYIDSNSQVAVPSLRITTPTQVEWFSVTVPASTTGTMVVTDQSTNLSMLSPTLWVYKAGSGLPAVLGSVSSTAYGATVSYTVSGVQPGQTYLFRTFGTTTANPTGGYGLEVNFGSVAQPPVAPPNTVVPQQPDQGGGSQFAVVGLLEIASASAVPNMGSGIAVVPMNPLRLAVTTSTIQKSNTAGWNVLAAGTNYSQFQSYNSALSQMWSELQTATSADSGSALPLLQALDYLIMNWNDPDALTSFTW